MFVSGGANLKNVVSLVTSGILDMSWKSSKWKWNGYAVSGLIGGGFGRLYRRTASRWRACRDRWHRGPVQLCSPVVDMPLGGRALEYAIAATGVHTFRKGVCYRNVIRSLRRGADLINKEWYATDEKRVIRKSLCLK